MLKKIKKAVKDMKVAIAIGMSNADKEIMSSSFTKLPEASAVTNPNYSQNGFLRATQMGVMKEEQLKRFYQVLDGMDYIHTRTKVEWMIKDVPKGIGKEDCTYPEPGQLERYVYDENGEIVDGKLYIGVTVIMTEEELAEQAKAKQLLGDYIVGYETYLSVTMKQILIQDKNSLTATKKLNASLYQDSVVIDRGERMGVIKIEDFLLDVLVKQIENTKEEDQNVILEFYCANYNIKTERAKHQSGVILEEDQTLVPDAVFNKINEGNNLAGFTDIKKVLLYQTTSTRNGIQHNFQIVNTREVKKLKKGFVVKFNAKKC